MQKFFTILGGMGTLATEAYIHLINQYTKASCDQDYLNYILVNHATIPDRTNYILYPKDYPNPLPALINDIKQQNQLHPMFYTLPCNTAHYFYKQLQKVANAPILNMPYETVKNIKDNHQGVKRVGLIATRGTLADKIYNNLVKKAGYQLVLPTHEIENGVMNLIYRHVKNYGDPDKPLYSKIIKQMTQNLNCDVVILGCTELSYVQEKLLTNYPVIDAQSVLARQTVKLARKLA